MLSKSFSVISKMEVGPDGSFPRITSTGEYTSKDISCFKIVEVPEEERKESGLLYNLVWTGAEENESELSDKSSEWTDEDSPLQLPVENTEKSKDTGYEAKVQAEINKPLKKSSNEDSARCPKNKFRHRKNRNRNRYNSAKRKFNTSSKHYNYNPTYKGCSASTSNVEESSYNQYKFNNSFGASSNFERNNQPTATSPNDLEPWATLPVMLNTVPNYQYPNYLMYPYMPPVEHIGHTPLNSSVNKSRESVGILGDSPYCHHSVNFLSNSQNANFAYGDNYWNNSEYNPSAYYRGCGQTYFPRRKGWNKNRKRNRHTPGKNSMKQNVNRR